MVANKESDCGYLKNKRGSVSRRILGSLQNWAARAWKRQSWGTTGKAAASVQDPSESFKVAHPHHPPLLVNLHVSLHFPEGVAGLAWPRRASPPLDQSAMVEEGENLSLNCTTLSKLHDLFMPQFPHLWNGGDHSICPGGAIVSTSCSSSWCLTLLGSRTCIIRN